MEYVALEWDHKIGMPMIRWIVVHCAGLSRKCGGPQALSPRRDIAYFVNQQTAERDARSFAAYKNAQQASASPAREVSGAPLARHAAFAWDHLLFSPLLRWAVLEWPGEGAPPGPRKDIAYFLDADTAESDAAAFGAMRDRWLIDGAGSTAP